MSDFEVFYRGVPVPSALRPNLSQPEAIWFKNGVNAVLDQPTEVAAEPFVGRVFIDNDGDKWHEQSPDSFDCRYTHSIDWSIVFLHKTEEYIRHEHGPINRIKGPAFRH